MEGERAEPRRAGRALVLAATVAAVGLLAYLVWPTDEPVASSRPGPDPRAPVDGGAPVEGARLRFRPIPPDALSNRDPSDLSDLAAGSAPLVAPDVAGPDPEGALARATRALADDPEDLQARRTQALVSLALARADGVTRLEALVASHPTDLRAQTALGHVRMRQGRYDEADAALSAALAIDPEHAPALRYRGILRRRRGQTRDAYHDLVGALRVEPDDLYALVEITEVFVAVDREADAAPFFRRIAALRPDSAEAAMRLSLSLAASGAEADLDEAITVVEHALSLAPDYMPAHRQYCGLLAENERAGAVAACDAAIRSDPSNDSLFAARARVLARQELWVRALADADRAIELAPENGERYGERAAIRAPSGDDPGALSDLTAACRLDDDLSCARLAARGLTP